jgi:hypothetical protein
VPLPLPLVPQWGENGQGHPWHAAISRIGGAGRHHVRVLTVYHPGAARHETQGKMRLPW